MYGSILTDIINIIGSVWLQTSNQLHSFVWQLWGHSLELRVLDENAPHDASCVIQIIAEALERVNGLCSKRNQSFPSKLLVIGDNTVRELKNSHCLQYLANLIGRRKMRLCVMMMLRKSHTHCRLDQLFGIISRRVANTDKIHSADDTVNVLNQEMNRPGFRAFVGSSTEVSASRLNVTYNWRDQYRGQGVSVSGGLLVDSTANHCFVLMQHKGGRKHLGGKLHSGCLFPNITYSRWLFVSHVMKNCKNSLFSNEVMSPWDLPEQLQAAVNYGSWRGDINPGNTICLVKRYIADGDLSQPPLLVLPASRVEAVPLVPRVKHLAQLAQWNNELFELWKPLSWNLGSKQLVNFVWYLWWPHAQAWKQSLGCL